MSLTATANPPRWQSAALWVVRGLLALAFASAGCAKLYGVPMLVEEFQHIGLGEWFRYFTGSLVPAVVLLVLSAVVAYAKRDQFDIILHGRP